MPACVCRPCLQELLPLSAHAQPAAPRAPRRMLVEVQSTVDFFKDRIKFWARSIERQGIDLELVLVRRRRATCWWHVNQAIASCMCGDRSQIW